MTFTNMLPEIQAMAANMCKGWGNKFEVNELVNEAWMRSSTKEIIDAPLIMRAAYCDMLDYIRNNVGREHYYVKGEKKKSPHRFKLVSNYDSDHDDCRSSSEYKNPYSIFDGEKYEEGYASIDNKELISVLLSNVSTKKATAIVHYYLEDKNLVETGTLMKRSNCTISTMLKQARTELVEAAANIGIDSGDIIGR